MFTRELTRCRTVALEKRSQTGVHAFDVFVSQGLRQDGVHATQQVVDVAAARRWVGEVQVPVGIGGADDPVALPLDDE